MAERAGYTLTMFLIDVSPSMGQTREVEIPHLNGETHIVEMSNLERGLQFVKLKIQEMIYNGRKTDQCSVILFGTEETDNIVNTKVGGYEHVSMYIPVCTPNAETIAKLSRIQPGPHSGDPIDALIVGIDTQDKQLATKKTWTRKMVLITDGENPMEIEDWEATAQKMNDLKVKLAIVGIDFDEEEYEFKEEDKSDIKRANEEFFHKFVAELHNGVVGNCDFALEEISRPESKSTKSALLGTVLRMGDTENHPEESVEIYVKTSKATAIARPKSWKKFAVRRQVDDDEDVIMQDPEDDGERKMLFAQLGMRTKYILDTNEDVEETEETDDVKQEDKSEDDGEEKKSQEVVVEKEDLIRGYKYGSSYAPCPEGSFPKLETKKGIEICGFISSKNFRHDLAMGEVQYVWADPGAPLQQAALSSVVEAMYERGSMAIGRWVSKDGADPKIGILSPMIWDNADCFLWVQMPFADDVRKYPFPSLDKLINKKGEVVSQHPYLPTPEQLDAMEEFVDAMDLTEAGEKDEEGNRGEWFDTTLSYNPAVHRIKQAQFHAAVVTDLNKQPLPPPHPELTKYFEPPKRMIRHAKKAIEAAKAAFKVREVPKKITRSRNDEHRRARDEGDDALLLENAPKKRKISGDRAQTQAPTQATQVSPKTQRKVPKKTIDDSETESETEDEDGQDLLLNKSAPNRSAKLPTPERSPSPPLNPGREPGRIIGFAYPLRDFKENIAKGDLVTKAVEDLAYVIKTIVIKPFTSRRTDELIKCLQQLRKTAGEEDEIDAWNAFLKDLKKACLEQKPGNRDFWDDVCNLGRDISLISKSEAAQLGGKSDVTEAYATEFIRHSN